MGPIDTADDMMGNELPIAPRLVSWSFMIHKVLLLTLFTFDISHA